LIGKKNIYRFWGFRLKSILRHMKRVAENYRNLFTGHYLIMRNAENFPFAATF